MSELYSVERGTIFAFKNEAQEGTAPTPAGTDAVLYKSGASIKTGREEIDRELVLPSLSQVGHLLGMYTDAGFSLSTEGRASGTLGTAPEISEMLQNVMGDVNVGVAGVVQGVTTASTSVFTVNGAELADEDDILIQVGTSYQAGHIDVLTAGTGVQVVDLLGTVSIAPVHGANIVDLIVDDTVTADSVATATEFSVATVGYTTGASLLVEVTDGSGYYYPVTVSNIVDHTTYQTVTVTPALPAAPATGDNVVINTSVTTVIVCAAPSTIGCTVIGATMEAGHILRIQTGASTYQYALCKTYAGYAATWSPPVSVAPTAGYAIQPGVKYALKSSYADFTSGCGFFYFKNGTLYKFPGSRGTAKFTLEVGKPLLIDWEFGSLSYAHSQEAALASPSVNMTTQPPLCLGIFAYFVYPAVGAAGSSTTSTILSATTPLEAAIGDTLIIDKGSSVYETKTLTGWNFSTQTATTSAFTGALSAGEDAYLRRCLEISKLEIEVMPEWETAMGMCNSYGQTAKIPVSRAVNITYDKHFKSDYELYARDNLESVEIFAVYGNTSGNIIAFDLPNVLRKTVEYKLDGLQGETITGQAYADSTAGDDEIFITYL